MRLLVYKGLDTRRVKPAFAKIRAAIEAGDFRSADVKKLAPTAYWRAKLDYANGLLLQLSAHAASDALGWRPVFEAPERGSRPVAAGQVKAS